MKKRLSFVTNSSSSSFIVSKKLLTHKQILHILNPYPLARKNKHIFDTGGNLKRHIDDWELVEKDDKICGFTLMENFEFNKFLDLIGVKKEQITYKKNDALTCDDIHEIMEAFKL